MLATTHGRSSVIECLLGAGARVQEQTHTGKTALDYALQMKRTKIYAMLSSYLGIYCVVLSMEYIFKDYSKMLNYSHRPSRTLPPRIAWVRRRRTQCQSALVVAFVAAADPCRSSRT